jgi:hypothetical protein
LTGFEQVVEGSALFSRVDDIEIVEGPISLISLDT